MKHLAKKILYAVAPQWTTAVQSARARAHSHRVVAQWGCGPATRKLIDRLGNRVLEGAFAGLILTPMTYAEQIGPFLLGLYESELDAAWDTVSRGTYAQILDIGAKFGFYAVGLARHHPNASVVAFDTDRWAREAVREMSAANGTPNVVVEGFCTPDWIARNIREGAFVLSDCEGYEAALFAPEILPHLRSATLIIETHDCFVPGVSDRLHATFDTTHIVTRYGDTDHGRTTAIDLDFLTDSERDLAVREVRPPQVWLLCLPRTGPNAHLADLRS